MNKIYEVKIYDRNGELIKIVQPKIDYGNLTTYGNPKGRKTFNKIPKYCETQEEIMDEE